MRIRLLFAAALAAGALAAREVRVGSVECNPGAEVAVPVTLDNAQGLAVASVTVAYDPLVLVLTEVREGSLADAFSFDFSVAEETGAVTVVAVAPDNIAEPRTGTVAKLVFTARPGSEGLHSALALADVRLDEATMTRDLTKDNPITPIGGLIRPLGATADRHERLGDRPIVVAAGTRLNSLALNAGDAIQASAGDPVTVAETATYDGPDSVRIAAPEGGWLLQRYAVLRCPIAAPRPTLSTEGVPETYALSWVEEGDTALCLLQSEQSEPTLTLDEGVELSADEEGAVRELLALALEEGSDSPTAIKATGNREAIVVCAALGVLPKTTLTDGTLTAAFALPTLRITAFDPMAGSATVQVVPPAGAKAIRSIQTGVLHLLTTTDLAQPMTEVDATFACDTGKADVTLPDNLRVRLSGGSLFLKVIADPERAPSPTP